MQNFVTEAIKDFRYWLKEQRRAAADVANNAPREPFLPGGAQEAFDEQYELLEPGISHTDADSIVRK